MDENYAWRRDGNMQYRTDEKSGNQLSILGFGCMRLPANKARAESLVMQAYKAGVNYYDTAYLYAGSEETVGRIFEKNGIRGDIYIATKLPHMMCRTYEDFDKYFEMQKRRLRTDYIDYYLIHNISDFKQWETLCGMGIEKWIAEKKTAGEIKRIGFSYHGSQPDFFTLLDAYDWDFVQIQYNYININYQAGMAGLHRAAQKGLPVIIMEPLLGGKLANGLPGKAVEIMRQAQPDATPAGWGLRWLWNQPEVSVVLSGMNEEAQLAENLELAENARAGMFGERETQVIEQVIDVFNASYKVRCTGCNYCMPCPKNINIPACFGAYNNSYAISWRTGEMQYLNATGMVDENPRMAGDCVECGQCEKHCPQGIEIRRELKAVKKRLEFPGMKTLGKIARRAMRGGPKQNSEPKQSSGTER